MQVRQQDFTHGTQHQEDDGADEQVHKNDGGTSYGDGSAGSHKKAGADGTADSDELNMSVAQTAVQALRLFGNFGGDSGLVVLGHDVLFSADRPRSVHGARRM